MLSKFISVSETRFQNTEIALKNQQALISGLETQIGQLPKLISERPQARIQQDNTMNKGREEVNDDDPKQMPNSAKFLKELLANKRKLDATSHVELNAVCSAILKNKLPNKLKDPGSFTIPCLIGSLSVNSALADLGATINVMPLRIEKLDEWREHKPRTYDKPKLHKNKPDTSPNQLKVGDTVLLDAVDPHIVTTTPNEEIPLTVLSIFPFGTVEVSHPKFGTFKVNNTRFKPYFKIDNKNEEYELLKPP
ncbi:hypothetical protein GOBAR_AA17042 [Gossypium barbadense]|uniref:Aspartic peptidase DDI1-type domain-containing protein n=1 Tax=Gossypium barbadense TaxID=3634 RepID=A0A2P5XJZ9_GOSBA|nr:hypothetical protein GOBAR_AA17042 [Gossypium barbadense]